MNHARASHTALTILAATALAACSDVGDYIPPEDDMAQDMSAADMSSSPDDMKEDTPDDMSEEPADMSESEDLSSPDMPVISNAPRLSVMSSAEGVELSWSALDGALGYEVKIDDGEWIDAGQATTYTDTEAPSGSIISATIDASDATRREAVDLNITDIQLEEAPEREYRVRAIFNTGEGDESAPKSARRITEVKAYQWQYTDDDTLWMDIPDATMDTAEDPTARASGNARRYRVLIDTGDGNAPTPSQPDEGFRLAAIKVGTGASHSCVLFNNGKVKCWGQNQFGQLGYGDIETRGTIAGDMPTADVVLGAKAKSLAVGGSYNCVILEDDTVRCWGTTDGTPEQLSDPIGDAPGEMPPAPIPLSKKPISLDSLGAGHQCVLLEDGEASCWGMNEYGQLGLENTQNMGLDSATNLPTPTLSLGAKVKHIANGGLYSCAITETDEAMCWGRFYGAGLPLNNVAIGAMDGDMPLAAIQTTGSGFRPVAFSQGWASQHMCVIADHAQTTTRTVYCWGHNAAGQLGAGHQDTIGDGPNEMPGHRAAADGATAVKVATSLASTCILQSNDKVVCWGSMFLDYPILGPEFLDAHGDEMSELRANPLELGGPVADIAFSIYHACAVMKDGNVKCWGSNEYGQLGQESIDTIGADPAQWPPPNIKLW